ncbi:MAG TPA: hypothetical protein VFD41_06845 [Actinomycetales bacterium]|nr:hypothetical protein [Actinomycetales bacterium]
MAGFMNKVTKLANNPKGRRAIEQARVKAEQMAKDPATRAKIDAGVNRVKGEVDKRRKPKTTRPPEHDGRV